jgi:uncharacterized delta-60 repeat protein
MYFSQPYDIALARLNSDGTLDSTFGTGGKAYASFYRTSIANALSVQPDGKILVAGSTFSRPEIATAFAIARFLPDGSLDNTFGVEGKLTTRFNCSEKATAQNIFSDGNYIFLVGLVDNRRQYSVAFARFNMRGEFDASYGNHNGKKTARLLDRDTTIRGSDLDVDGKVLVSAFRSFANLELTTLRISP